jgi:hypothetical protein
MARNLKSQVPTADALVSFVTYSSAVTQQLSTLKTIVTNRFGYGLDDIHWGHAGAVRRISSQLSDILASLEGFAK